MPNSLRARLACLAALVAVIASAPARATVIPIEPGVETTSLAGVWKFHPGDDLAWAKPGFDDAAWDNVKVPGILQTQGYPGFDGIGWYRVTLRLPAARGDLALSLGPVLVGYEIYANGRRIGSVPDDFRRGVARSLAHTWVIPPDLLKSSTFVIALRIQGDPAGSGFPPNAPVYIGAHVGAEAISNEDNLVYLVRGLPWYLYPLAFVFVPLMLALYWNQRDRDEYLWAAAFAFLQALFGVAGLVAAHTELLSSLEFGRLSILLNLGILWARVELLVFLVGETRRRFLLAPQWITSAIVIATVTNAQLAQAIYNYQDLTFLPFRLVLVWVAVRCLRSKSWETWLLAVLAIAEFVAGAPTEFHLAMSALHGAAMHGVNVVYVPLFGYFRIALTGLIDIVWILVICGLVFRRYVVTSREHRRMADELEAARLVQELLIPRAVEPTPGLDIESVYLPAQEVGGDFYQILSAPNGETFVAVGDVSGKGLKAAMVVSSIVGALQVESSRRPADVLASLNHMLMKKMDGGFVTCCCALFHRDGTVTIANAGHVAPYLDGEEMAVAPGLPLGISTEVGYHAQTFELSGADSLVFLSDGVIEARNVKGELFGFERTSALSLKSAGEIADEARAFGQHDDITVVRIRRIANPV